MIEFFLDCVPPTASHHRKHIVRIGKFSKLADDKSLVAAKQFLETLLLPHQLPRPLCGPVALTLEFTWPWRGSDSRRVRALGRYPKTSRPDCSNVAKTFEDRLVALRFLSDDNQVARLTVSKWVGDRPGVRVVLAPIDLASLPLTPVAAMTARTASL